MGQHRQSTSQPIHLAQTPDLSPADLRQGAGANSTQDPAEQCLIETPLTNDESLGAEANGQMYVHAPATSLSEEHLAATCPDAAYHLLPHPNDTWGSPPLPIAHNASYGPEGLHIHGPMDVTSASSYSRSTFPNPLVVQNQMLSNDFNSQYPLFFEAFVAGHGIDQSPVSFEEGNSFPPETWRA